MVSEQLRVRLQSNERGTEESAVALEQEYHWYRTGHIRLGYPPEEILSEADFAVRWQEWENHAERLKEAEARGTLDKLDTSERALKGRLMETDPFVKALLVGMGETEQNDK